MSECSVSPWYLKHQASGSIAPCNVLGLCAGIESSRRRLFCPGKKVVCDICATVQYSVVWYLLCLARSIYLAVCLIIWSWLINSNILLVGFSLSQLEIKKRDLKKTILPKCWYSSVFLKRLIGKEKWLKAVPVALVRCVHDFIPAKVFMFYSWS